MLISMAMEANGLGMFDKTVYVMDIGFINSDGQNDETELEGTVQELIVLYREFCKENKFPTNTVVYVDYEKKKPEDDD